MNKQLNELKENNKHLSGTQENTGTWLTEMTIRVLETGFSKDIEVLNRVLGPSVRPTVATCF